MDAAGFFGKLPSHGDFVSRRLSREFLDVWDNWLQRSIAESKAILGNGWLELYLTSPIWRFAMMPGVCGASGYLGLMMPSIDRVGRYFPLTVAVPLADGTSALGSAIAAAGWYEATERLLLSVLDDNAPNVDAFDQQVMSSVAELDGLETLALPLVEDGPASSSRHWQLQAAAGSSPGLAICSLAGGLILDEVGPASVWWTGGSDVTGASFVAALGLPDPAKYTTMLGSQNADMTPTEAIPEDWHDSVDTVIPEDPPTVPPRVLTGMPSYVPTGEPDSTVSLEALINSPVALRFKSAAKTVTGKVRRENEDAVLVRAEQSMWVVADGMGGHAAGKTASSAIVTAMEEADLPDDIEGRIQTIARVLQSVNRQLRSFAEHRREVAGLGSTVAVLVIADGMGAIIWAGDTRVYRKRGGQLDQLTVDHSEHQERMDRGDIGSILGGGTNVVTRAVGGDIVLQVSIVRQSVHPGDRFLLCSDGLYEELPAFQMEELLGEPDCARACDALMDAVLEGRAKDNASAIIVDASNM